MAQVGGSQRRGLCSIRGRPAIMPEEGFRESDGYSRVLSVDEKSQIQALDRTQPGLPMKRGRAGTITSATARPRCFRVVRDRLSAGGGFAHEPHPAQNQLRLHKNL